jgi:hypothetical protein
VAEDDTHDHDHPHHHERGRAGIGQFFTNWREYDAPLPTKLSLTVRNWGLRVGRRKFCCGHPGQPGC